MDHRSGTEEQQGLEEGVGDEVEDAGDVGGDADAEEHVAELADRRVGEDPLDVALADRDRGGEQRRHGTDRRHRRRRDRGQFEERPGAGDHVDAGRHHGRGMDERRDRRGALHRVRQPDVEGELGGLAGGAHQEEQRDGGGHPRGQHLGRLFEHRAVGQRAELAEDDHEGDQEPEVADPVDDERLLAGGCRRRLLEPERDQKVRRHADEFPPHEEDPEVLPEDEDQHRHDE